MTAPPADEPVSVEEARAQVELEEGDTTFDTLLNAYRKAARQHAERVTDQKLVTQTVKLRASAWADLERLPIGPIATVTKVEYLDSAGDLQELSTATWEAVIAGLQCEVRAKIGQTFPAVRPASDAIQLTVTAGYGAAAAVPEDLKLAQLLMIGDWFAHREDSSSVRLTEIPRGAMTLLQNHRL